MRQIHVIVTLSFLAAISLLFLFLHSDIPNRSKNGFIRQWITEAPRLIRQEKIPFPLEKISGQTGHCIYFSVKNPQAIVMLDQSAHSVQKYSFSIPVSDRLTGSRTLVVDSPWVFLFANNVPAIYYGRFGNKNIKEVPIDTSSLFTKSAYLSPTKSVLRRFDKNNKQYFQVVHNQTGKVLATNTIVDHQDNMGFSSDGILQYDSASKSIVYVLYYQNIFYRLDTNLNIVYLAHTIDTSFSNPLSVGVVALKGEDRVVPLRSRRIVNEKAVILHDKILIFSGLKSDNQSRRSFNKNSVVDIYRIKDGGYQGSFSIPNIGGGKVRSAWCSDSTLTILYDNHLTLYDIYFCSA